jgi:hypothetical protein
MKSATLSLFTFFILATSASAAEFDCRWNTVAGPGGHTPIVRIWGWDAQKWVPLKKISFQDYADRNTYLQICQAYFSGLRVREGEFEGTYGVPGLLAATFSKKGFALYDAKGRSLLTGLGQVKSTRLEALQFAAEAVTNQIQSTYGESKNPR